MEEGDPVSSGQSPANDESIFPMLLNRFRRPPSQLRMTFLSMAAVPAALFLLTSCGSLTPAQQKTLESTGQAYGQIHQGETRAAARTRLGPPQSTELRQDEWEYLADEANGESLALEYDRKNVIIDGQRSTWRGDQRGIFRWSRKTGFYLPRLPPNPGPEALRSRSMRREIQL